MHFEFSAAYLTNDDAIAKLKRYISNYDKSKTKYIDYLIEKQNIAINNSKKLRKTNETGGKNKSDNPSTTVDELVEYLEKLRKKSLHI